MIDLDLHRIHVFVAVVKNKGYAPSARALGIDDRRLSHAVIMLEKSLGVRLINRSTRYKGLTWQGKAYYSHMAPLLDRLQAAIEDIRSREVLNK